MISFLLLFWTICLYAGGDSEISLNDSFLRISDEFEPIEDYPDFDPTLTHPNAIFKFPPPLNERQINLLKRKREMDEIKAENEEKIEIPKVNAQTIIKEKSILIKEEPKEPFEYFLSNDSIIYLSSASFIIIMASGYFVIKYYVGK